MGDLVQRWFRRAHTDPNEPHPEERAAEQAKQQQDWSAQDEENRQFQDMVEKQKNLAGRRDTINKEEEK